MMTNRADDEAGSPPISPEARHAPRSDEPATLQMNQQNHLIESDKNHLLPFQERGFNESNSTSVQQDEASEDASYGLPVDAHNTGTLSTQSGPTPPPSRVGELVGADNVSTVSQEDSAGAAIEALATKPGCDTPREATVCLAKLDYRYLLTNRTERTIHCCFSAQY